MRHGPARLCGMSWRRPGGPKGTTGSAGPLLTRWATTDLEGSSTVWRPRSVALKSEHMAAARSWPMGACRNCRRTRPQNRSAFGLCGFRSPRSHCNLGRTALARPRRVRTDRHKSAVMDTYNPVFS